MLPQLLLCAHSYKYLEVLWLPKRTQVQACEPNRLYRRLRLFPSCRNTHLRHILDCPLNTTLIQYIRVQSLIVNILRLDHTYPYHDQPHDVQPRFMEDESGTCKHPLPYIICLSLCGDPPLSLIMHMQSSHQPIKPHSYIS